MQIFLLDILLAFGFVAPFSLLSFKLFNNHYPWLVFLCLKIDHPIRMILAYRKLRNFKKTKYVNNRINFDMVP